MKPAKRFSFYLNALVSAGGFGLFGAPGFLESPPLSAYTPSRDPVLTFPQVLAPALPYSLVVARRADRNAWIDNGRVMRNVYTAAAPIYAPVRLTTTMADDGRDLSGVQFSDDGSVVI